MFEADAWGPEQMTEMIEMVKRDHGSLSFHKQAEDIAAKLNAPEFSTNPRHPEGESRKQEGKEEAMAAAKAAGRSEADLITLAKDAIAERYRMKLLVNHRNPKLQRIAGIVDFRLLTVDIDLALFSDIDAAQHLDQG